MLRCVALGLAAGISIQRATRLLAMSHTRTLLATQKDRLRLRCGRGGYSAEIAKINVLGMPAP